MAEPEGFEPSIPGKRYAALAKRCLQPLGHSSIAFGYARRGRPPQAPDRKSSLCAHRIAPAPERSWRIAPAAWRRFHRRTKGLEAARQGPASGIHPATGPVNSDSCLPPWMNPHVRQAAPRQALTSDSHFAVRAPCCRVWWSHGTIRKQSGRRFKNIFRFNGLRSRSDHETV